MRSITIYLWFQTFFNDWDAFLYQGRCYLDEPLDRSSGSPSHACLLKIWRSSRGCPRWPRSCKSAHWHAWKPYCFLDIDREGAFRAHSHQFLKTLEIWRWSFSEQIPRLYPRAKAPDCQTGCRGSPEFIVLLLQVQHIFGRGQYSLIWWDLTG